jgi:hypothetical protein
MDAVLVGFGVDVGGNSFLVHIREHVSHYDEQSLQKQGCLEEKSAGHFKPTLTIDAYSSTLSTVHAVALYAVLCRPAL